MLFTPLHFAHGATPAHLVVTHPAVPEGMRCEMVERIAEDLFPGALVVPEPIAAAVKLACDGSLPPDCIVAVYDFGGGTFDLTLVRRDGDRFSMVTEPDGLPTFGGIDVDDLILDHVNQGLGGAVTRLDLADPAAMAAMTSLRTECRAAKERLSYEPDVAIETTLPGEPGMVRLTRADFEQMLLPRLEETVEVLQRAIAAADLRPDEVDTVALVGGSSRIPLVAELLGARTTIPVLVDPYPELTVALGACQMVDDDAPSSSVFPLSDLALPSLTAFSETGTAAGAAGGAPLAASFGRLADDSPGGHLEPGLGHDPDDESEFDHLLQRGRDMDGGDHGDGRRPPGAFVEGLNPKIGAAVLAGIVVVLLMAVILLGGGGDGPGDAETAGASGTQSPTSSSLPGSSTSSSASSSSSTSSTSSSTTTTEDEDEGPPNNTTPTTDRPPSDTTPTTRPRPTTTTTSTTTTTTTTSTTTTSTTTTTTTTTTPA